MRPILLKAKDPTKAEDPSKISSIRKYTIRQIALVGPYSDIMHVCTGSDNISTEEAALLLDAVIERLEMESRREDQRAAARENGRRRINSGRGVVLEYRPIRAPKALREVRVQI